MMTVLFWLAALAYAVSIWLFLRWAGEDADSWVTPFDRFTHPYRLRTQLMLIPVLLGWVLPLALWDLR